MKIADVAEFYSERGGGVRTYVQAKLRSSARLGHETVVIAPGAYSGEQKVAGGKIVWVKAPVLPADPRYHVFVSSAEVRRVLEREDPDLVEGSSPWLGGWIAAGWEGSTARVLFVHSDPVASYGHSFLAGKVSEARIDRLAWPFWWYLQRLNRRFTATIVGGEWLQRRLEHFGLHGIQTVPMGVDASLFSSANRNEEVRRSMLEACGLPAEASLLVAVGRLHPEKRYDTLIDAATRASRIRPVGLYIIGDGPGRRGIEERVRDLPHGFIAGAVDHGARLAAMVASADALIHGGGSETYGLAVAEAIASGVPVIVPNAGGAGELGRKAFAETYVLGDGASAARAIEAMLNRLDGNLVRRDFLRAHNVITSEDAHFDRLFELYEGLVTSRSKLSYLWARS